MDMATKQNTHNAFLKLLSFNTRCNSSFGGRTLRSSGSISSAVLQIAI